MDNFDQKAILNELIQIRKLLTILSQDKLQSFNDEIERKYLTTDQRKTMYSMFDGSNSYKEIAQIAKVSAEAVRQFAVQLEQAGLVEMIAVNAKSKNPKRIF